MTDSILLFSALTGLLSHTLTKLHDVKHACRSFKKSFFMSNFLVIRSILTHSPIQIYLVTYRLNLTFSDLSSVTILPYQNNWKYMYLLTRERTLTISE